MSVFESLNGVNVNEHTEKKNGLTYLSWAWAWGELLKRYPDSTYTVYENKDGWNYHTDGKTCWVKTGVTVNGIEHVEYLPVMDFKNRSIPLDQVTSFDVNKAIQRSLTKAVARHGLGLYIYAGEDLPEGESEPEPADKVKPVQNDGRREIVTGLCKQHGIEATTFNAMYRDYCRKVLKRAETPMIGTLTDDEFADMVTSINEQLKGGAA